MQGALATPPASDVGLIVPLTKACSTLSYNLRIVLDQSSNAIGL